MSLKQAQDSGLAPLASGEYGTRKTVDGAPDAGEDGIAQMVGLPPLNLTLILIPTRLYLILDLV